MFHELRAGETEDKEGVPLGGAVAGVALPDMPCVEFIRNGVARVRSRSSRTGGPDDGLPTCLRTSSGGGSSSPFQPDDMAGLEVRLIISVGREEPD